MAFWGQRLFHFELCTLNFPDGGDCRRGVKRPHDVDVKSKALKTRNSGSGFNVLRYMPLKRAISGQLGVVAVLFLSALPSFVPGQAPMPSDPAAARFVYDDVRNFLRAFAAVQAGAAAPEVMERDYFARATPGLRAIAAEKGVSAAALGEAIRRRPSDYRSLSNLVQRLIAHEPAMRKSFARLKELHPGAVFPPTYFLVSDSTWGGGHATSGGVVIGFGPLGFENQIDRMPYLVAHEMAHIQQASVQGVERYQAVYEASRSLLALAIREGSADLLAQLMSGNNIDKFNSQAHQYGLAHEKDLWKRFQAGMSGPATGDWMFQAPAKPDEPADLGYFIGYRIAESVLSAGGGQGSGGSRHFVRHRLSRVSVEQRLRAVEAS